VDHLHVPHIIVMGHTKCQGFENYKVIYKCRN